MVHPISKGGCCGARIQFDAEVEKLMCFASNCGSLEAETLERNRVMEHACGTSAVLTMLKMQQ